MNIFYYRQVSGNQICSHTLAHYVFLHHLQAKNDFYIFKWLGVKNKRRTFYDMKII